ncbi:hypothetical protein JCM8547_007975 [Rhodosporidiobolus lusitaniae]
MAGFDLGAFRSAQAQKNADLLNELQVKPPDAVIELASSSVKKLSIPRKKPSPSTPKASVSKSSPPASGAALVDQREKAGLRSSPRVRDSLLGLSPKKETRVEISEDGEEEHYYEGGKKVKTVYAASKLGKRRYDPKRYGSIPGVKVGTTFNFREEASTASIHAPWVAGISPGPQGVYSICVSGGYDGDVDMGERLTFSGSGGRDLKGTKGAEKNLRTAPQSSDQVFDTPMNAALLRSVKSGKPIRVLRGVKGKSIYAPKEGYRYDGLYVAVKSWQDVATDSKFKICRIALVRQPGQPPIPTQGNKAEEDEKASSSSDDEAASEAESVESMSKTSPEPLPSPSKRKRAGKEESAEGEEEAEQEAVSPKRRRTSRV